jgi:hypothetical protein
MEFIPYPEKMNGTIFSFYMEPLAAIRLRRLRAAD